MAKSEEQKRRGKPANQRKPSEFEPRTRDLDQLREVAAKANVFWQEKGLLGPPPLPRLQPARGGPSAGELEIAYGQLRAALTAAESRQDFPAVHDYLVRRTLLWAAGLSHSSVRDLFERQLALVLLFRGLDRFKQEALGAGSQDVWPPRSSEVGLVTYYSDVEFGPPSKGVREAMMDEGPRGAVKLYIAEAMGISLSGVRRLLAPAARKKRKKGP